MPKVYFSYYSLTSVTNIIERAGLIVSDVEYLPIHGGSLRYYISHKGKDINENVTRILKKENELGISRQEYYHEFNKCISALKVNLLNLLEDLKNNKKSIAAYGASAKGSTLLNTFGVNENQIDFIVDRSLYKQGYYIPGLHLEIVSPSELITRCPDYTLLLTWNFKEEILAQQNAYRDSGGKFILPLPDVKII